MLLNKAFRALLPIVALAAPAFAAFGITTSGSSWTVDTAGGLVFTINSSNGDITSMKFNGIEAQDSSKFSQISSGLGSASCTNTRTGNNNNYIIIACQTSTLTQYYVAQYKTPAIHMATYTTAEPSVGELRFIARLSRATLPTGPTAATIYGNSGAIEGSDVFMVNGQTRSKFYSSKRFIDDQVHGVTGSGIGAYMIIPGVGYESSSGGPFFRDIDFQGGDQSELYFYMNSGHVQTESYRQGLHGPYALWFTTGSAPSADFDTTFWEALNPSGLTTFANRGYVRGTASGIPSAFSDKIVIGWANSAAQYWVKASSSGAFTSPKMKPGTYTQTLYKNELAVGTTTVTVSTGTTVTANIADTHADDSTSYIWQIGDFDGTPAGFKNADKIETMHPSDTRMGGWAGIAYTVGSSAVSSFPMALFKDVGPVTVNFSLSSSQTGARTLKIATTLAFAGGRPTVTVNGWSSSTPPAPSQPDSRGVTRGTWRGNNNEYTYAIPSGTLVAGSNTLTIYVASGSSGSDYLSPNFIFDALALY
ncbi:polysaccharide lyase family 4 protein [Lentinus tigrinus ALCF2SS1-7]|uniref:polysaccharide lyase family 4 protein n=1 Tax=Lentinus tigrinus ALCF2SS1-7 TaxID=1328758 RepID=UPI001165CDCD|nr:polysaccharide lyase family 4 protein [Lentinus tigrinus ALCF2SS1-7]